MSDQFLAEIRIFPFNFPPTGWAFCDGQIMPISQNTALFSLLGTTYGGDGKSTFALPDLQGAAPMQPGQGQGLSCASSRNERRRVYHAACLVRSRCTRTWANGSDEDDNSTLPANHAYGKLSVAYAPAAALGTMAPQSLSLAGAACRTTTCNRT